MKTKLLYTFGAIALGLLSTNSFSQTTPFVPQVKDWGTFLPINSGIPVSTAAYNFRPVIDTRNSAILTGIINENDPNSVIINNWMNTDSHQSVSAGANDAILYSIAQNGTLNWATYLGGEKDEIRADIVLDADDNIYVSGTTNSSTGIATEGAFQTAHTNYYLPPLYVNMGGISVQVAPAKILHNFFLAKFNSEGNLLWSTYFSGDKGSEHHILKPFVGNSGIYISGRTMSSQNLATAGSLQPNWPENVPTEPNESSFIAAIPFVAKFSFSGELLWCTYTHNIGPGIANIDANDNIYLFFEDSIASEGEIHPQALTKLSSNGDSILETIPFTPETTYQNIFHDAFGNLYFFGRTSSATIGTAGTFNPTRNTFFNVEPFVEKYDSNMNKLWGTYLTRDNPEFSGLNRADIISVSDSGEMFFSGEVKTNGLSTSEVYQENLESLSNNYAMKLNTDGALEWFTYHGGNAVTTLGSGAIGNNSWFVTGTTESLDSSGITTPNGLIPEVNTLQPLNGHRAYLARLIPNQELSTTSFGDSQVLVYPNPAKEKLTVMSTHLFSAKTKLEIYDSLGKKISEHKGISANVNSIDVSALSQGMYFLKITDGKLWQQTIKFVKE